MPTATLRSCIVSAPDYTFISIDASQIELRVLAILSQDPQMLEDLQTGDLHMATAIRMFGWTDDEDEMKKRRYKAKQGNFALVYMASEYKLAEMLECTVEEALEFMADHKEAYPRLYVWMEAMRVKVREDGFTMNLFGRIRPMPELYAGSFKQREAAEREIVNTIVQGTAVDIVKLMMLYLRKAFDPAVRFVLQVHDEIVLEVPDELMESTLGISKELEQAFPDYPVTTKVGRIYSRLEKVGE